MTRPGNSRYRVGVLASHPVQYHSPLFRSLAPLVDLQVFYAMRVTPKQQAEAGFGVEFDWDVDLLTGYPCTFLENLATTPSVNAFRGCDTPGIEAIVRDGGFDAFVVFGWGLKCYWQAVWACRRAGVPVLVRGDSHLGTPRSMMVRLAKELSHRLMLRMFDGFLVVGTRAAAYLHHYGVAGDRMFSVPHFVDNQWFEERARAGRTQRDQARAQMGIGSEEVVALFVGKLLPLKRPLDLLSAAAVLREKGVRIACVFVGAGAMAEAIDREAVTMGIDVYRVGFRNQSALPAYYALADVLVLPSESETWGLVVNEAMACGRPAVVSDQVGCQPDLVIPGETGEVFEVGNAGSLAEALQRVAARIHSPELERAISARIARFSVEAATQGVIEAVESTVARRRHE